MNDMARNYPIQCGDCGERAVVPTTIERTIDVRHECTVHSVVVPNLAVLRCSSCGGCSHTNDSELAILHALREHLGFLQPEEIRSRRKALRLRQVDLGEAIGVASESISRWETGALVQSRSSDRILRAYFDLPELRSYLGRWMTATETSASPASAASAAAEAPTWSTARASSSGRKTAQVVGSDGAGVEPDRDAEWARKQEFYRHYMSRAVPTGWAEVQVPQANPDQLEFA